MVCDSVLIPFEYLLGTRVNGGGMDLRHYFQEVMVTYVTRLTPNFPHLYENDH